MKRAILKVGDALRLPATYHRYVVPNQATIIMYHGITVQPLPFLDWCFVEEAEFSRQISYLAQNFEIVPLSEILKPRRPTGQPKAALTFDDGFASNYHIAYPLLKRLGLPFTIYLVSDLIGTDDTVWFCHVIDAIARSRREHFEWDGKTYYLTDSKNKALTSARIQSRLKSFRPDVQLAELTNLLNFLDVKKTTRLDADSPFHMLSWDQVRTMARQGIADFGGHTSQHHILSQLSSECRKMQINQSVDCISREIGNPCRTFAYPNGRVIDWGDEDVETLRQSGVSTAVSTVPGPVKPGDDPLRLHRYGIGAGTEMYTFRWIIHHLLEKIRPSSPAAKASYQSH